VNKGSQIPPKNPKLDIVPIARVYQPFGWKCNPVNAEFSRRFLDLAEAHRIAVYWLVPPVCPEIQARRDEGGADADYMRFLVGMQKRYSNVVVIDGRHAGYDHTLHTDATHLDRQGSAVMSTDVAEIVARGLSRPNGVRWVTLPPYRDLPDVIAIEDLNQSILASRLARREVKR
jgi:hypothetical protein